MPYVTQDQRAQLAYDITPRDAGELNFCITRLCHRYLQSKDRVSYAAINEVIGVLQCAQMELYRVIAVPYEDVKREENGPV